MMDNVTFRANMNAAAVTEGNMQTQAKQAQEPGIHELLAHLSDLAKENRSLSYQIRDNLFGLIPTDGNSCEKTIGCAKDAIEDSIERFGGVEEGCRFAWDSSAHQYRMVDKWNQFSMIPVFQSYAEARNWAEERMKEAIAEGYIVAFPERKTTKKQSNPPTWNRKE